MSTFSEREPAKKRVVTVSVTKEQDAEFERLKAHVGLTTDGALIKAALAEYSDRVLGGRTKGVLSHDEIETALRKVDVADVLDMDDYDRLARSVGIAMDEASQDCHSGETDNDVR